MSPVTANEIVWACSRRSGEEVSDGGRRTCERYDQSVQNVHKEATCVAKKYVSKCYCPFVKSHGIVFDDTGTREVLHLMGAHIMIKIVGTVEASLLALEFRLDNMYDNIGA